MRVPPALARRGVQVSLALLAYAVFTVVLTWPLVAHLGSSVYLFPKNPRTPGDLAGSIAHLRELVDHHLNPFLPGREPDFNAPDGLPIRWALNLSSFPSVTLLYVLALAFGATAAYGLFVMLGYVASGVAMFLLARRLTGNAWIGFIAGWAFAFYPFAVVKGEHPHFAHGWVFVVMLWRFLVLLERPTLRNGVWAGAASILCFAWTQYFILLGGIAFWVLVVAVLAFGAVRRQFRRHLLALLPTVGLAAGFVLLMRSLLLGASENGTLPANTIVDILATSAHWPMYLVPPAYHPLGGATVDYLNRHGWNAVEWTLYVGLSVLALALVGLGAAALRRLPPPLARTALVSAVLIAVAFVFSLPPLTEVAGRSVHTPSWLLFHISPNWRLYTRFVVVVMLGLSVLAALGLKAVVQGRSLRIQAAILALATVVVPLDLWDRPPDHTFRLYTPSIYRTLRAQPPGIVAEYPLRSVSNVGHYLDLYYQQAHGKPIVNGYYQGPDEQRALRLANFAEQGTAGRLATLGVKYVLTTPQYLAPGAPDAGTPGKGFKEIAHDYYAHLYRVTAAPIPFVFGPTGLGPYEGAWGKRYQWMGTSPAQLEVVAPCKQCRGVLTFGVASFARLRTLNVSDEHGHDLAFAFVRTARVTRVSVPLRFSGRIVLELNTVPGPDSIRKVTGADDPRSVSIYVQEPTFVETKR